ncbi:hypothetical protein [Bacteroides helcogenes]|uniref:Uncharacterized protein n=1 Tax=Bacteroides helcogenes (strain ATCC 35417 / DSM 20613 / JCM 6297 / CCUG 15421 / P 36-108) TaxID=693979 RepID=E6SV44_BACT6|nr:hypothetical protein [Bacteroides helcogenes]ADV43426.1 hypothetical protein Bache_1421 [Bacteroides helcogenes P 36-108]MDY5238193.1 hypothetical protein [Bacteroides helcogenes]
MKRLIGTLTCTLILSAFHSCNSGVFIEDIRPSEDNIELDGNGDSVTIHFNSSNWEIISGECSLTQAFFKIYNAEGVNIGTSGAPCLDGVGKIILNDEQIDLTIERKHSKELTIKVDENIMFSRFDLSILVGNEYESKIIQVIISPCERYVLDDISYSLDAYEYYGNGVGYGKSITVNNETSTPLTTTIYPFRNIYHEVTFTSLSPLAFWLLEKNTVVDIPTIVDKSLVMDGVRASYTGDEQKIPISFANEEKKVTIPALSKQRITPILSYDWFETDFTIRAHNPKTNKKRTIAGRLRSNMPTKESHIIRETIEE